MARGFRLEGDLTRRLNQVGPSVKRAMVASANYAATQSESYMRENAPWTDRTGAARNGLRADVQVSTNKVALILYHSVAYGVFLEVRWGGKYAILQPTMEVAGGIWMEALGKMIFDEVAT